ncbi:MAG TPA: PEP-CTERM sorting domain-containing protein [Candidatus Sulfotelmatobacter sp.]|jgi:hypothetical protein|nr:PEP-CTERM sorting domain-containing protein [Candidatus Sulfotelmatobacter sp.]
MQMIRSAALAIACMFAVVSLAQADTLPALTLIPSDGAITGAAGTTVGWGFTLMNLGSNWLVVTGSDFCVAVITSPCSNSLGTYTDFIGQQFFAVGPSPESGSITQAFDNSTQTGMGSFFINPAATGSVFGEIALTYDLFSVDPNSTDFNPDLDTVSVGNYLTAPASVTVGTSTTVPTPEPRTLLLILAGIATLLAARRFLA